MNNYYREDIKVIIDLDPYKELLGEHTLNKEFDTRLIYNEINPEYLQITIYYTITDQLYEDMLLLKEKGVSILNSIKPIKTKDKFDRPEKYDFSKSNLIEMEDSNRWEHGKKPLILIIDNLDIFVQGSYSGDGKFQLTENIFRHLGEYINYGGLARYEFDDRFITENQNRNMKFGPIEFILSFEHFYDRNYETHSIKILRDAYLTITDDSEFCSNEQLLNAGNSLCLLMSFYWDKPIDFFSAHTRINDESGYRTRKTLKYSKDILDDSNDFLLKDQYKTFYDFIECISYKKYTAHSKLLQELVPRIIKTKNLDEVSAFMVLYNIIEKIRIFLLVNPIDDTPFLIKEEFDFIHGKDKTKNIIKNKIKELKDIVKDEDKEIFLKKASDKVTFIRKTGLKDQFDSLLKYLELNPLSYDINFTSLIKERNRIYHGNPPKEDTKSYIIQMKKLIYDLILEIISN